MASTKTARKRRKSNSAPRARDARLQELVELTSDCYWELDEKHCFTVMTGGNFERLGIDPRGALGRKPWELDAAPVGNDGSWEQHRATLEAHLPFSDLVLRQCTPRGDVRYRSVAGRPVFDAKGVFKGYRGVTKDITTAWREQQMLRLEGSVARCLAEADTPAAALKEVIRAVCETQGWECGQYWRFDELTGVLRFDEFWSVPSPALERFIEGSRSVVFTPGVGLAGHAWQSGEPLWVPDVRKDSRLLRRNITRETDMHGAFVFPVADAGRTIGVFTFSSREVREPDERLLHAVLVIGSQVGQFLQRKRAEQVLRESEQRFRSLTELGSDWYWEQDEEFRYTLVSGNPFTKSDHLIGKRRWETGALPVSGNWTEHQAVVKAHQPFRDFQLYRDRPGIGRYYISLDGEPMFDARGRFTGYRGIGQDITERLRREEDLRRFRLAMDNSADMIVLIDRATMRFADVNETACKLLGYSREELLQMGPQDVLPESRESLERAYDAFIADPVNVRGMRSAYRCRDGSTVPFESTRHVLRSGDGYIIAAISRDIRERIAAEAALHESNERFRSLTELSSDWYWEQDHEFRFTFMSNRKAGVTGNEFVGKARWEFPAVNLNDEDWARHRAQLERHEPFYDFEVCRLDPNGKKRWASLSGRPIFDERGHFVGYRGTGKDITERKLAEERIQYLAHHDGLTGLPNRAMFSEVLALTIVHAHRHNRGFAVLFIDLDRFKIINDTFGHESGDKLLQEIAKRLRDCVRASDVVARLGGDEFVILVQEVSDNKHVASVARKILSAAIRPVTIMGQECRVTASIGIATYPTDALDEHALMKNADIAMYRAKEEGKNNFQFYSEGINVHSLERIALETAMRRALERGEFLLHYQAKRALKTGEITGVEALLRWQHPDLGMVAPAQFIPLAEETGLIVPIGRWVLKTACAQAIAWLRDGLPAMRMAVNLSARQFADEALLDDVAAALQESGLAPNLLELELTESMVMQNHERALNTLAAIKEMGVRIAIDDFGVGYSSLAQIKRFPIDTLKVDRSFIRELPRDSEDRAITQAIIAMAKTLSLTVVAEGVETQEQVRFLNEHACDEMQGFFFSKPAAADQLPELLRRHAQIKV